MSARWYSRSIGFSPVLRTLKTGKIPVTKVGALNRFRRADIDAWLKESSRPAELDEAPATEGVA